MNGNNDAVPSHGGLSHICCPSSALGALEDEPTTVLLPNSSFKSRVADVGGHVGNDLDPQGQPNGAAAAAACPSTTGFFSKKSRQPIINKPDFLPILIIPGFMSSGLEIRKSNFRPDWEGKRLWLNLSSLGLSAFYFGSAQATTKKNNNKQQQPNEQQQEQQQQTYKSHWLEHMRLDSNYQERPGIQVRPIDGLEGVDYLTPGAFTNHVSYVFGPVIQALQLKSNGAYKPNINLQAAPYDWRLSPSQLEERDGYFTKVQHQVEGLYQMNGKTPIVIVGHSLGTKTAHYFFNFMANKPGCGREWLDKYIHTYIPVGAPHLGAPKALRSVVAGDKMGLDAFLDDEEALAMGRSFGSGPWLFPSHLPPGVPSSVYVMPHGVLEISFVQGSNGDQEAPARAATVNTYDLVHNRTALSKPNRYQLIVAYSGPKNKDDKDEGGEQKVSSPFVGVLPGQQYVVQFSDQVSFATNPNPKIASRGQLRFFLQEPGIAAAKQEKKEKFCCGFNPICCLLKCICCCCLCDLIYKIVRWITCGILGRGVALGADVISSGFGGGTNLASSYPVTIPPDVWTGRKGYVQQQVKLYHTDDLAHPYERILCFFVQRQPRSTTLHVRMRWIPYSNKSNGGKSGTQQSSAPVVCQPNRKDKTELKITRRNKKKQVYQEFSGHEILEREGLSTSTLELIHRVYDKDTEVGPRTKSSYDAPPVKRIHAIYGINIPTEIGGVYKRKDGCCLSKNKLDNLYKLDSKAIHFDDKKSGGFMIQNGLIFETPKTKQSVAGDRPVCGDGTVPYWSLQHCKTWRSDAENGPEARPDVSVIELDKAEHREILADARFHQALLDYCYIGGDPACQKNCLINK